MKRTLACASLGILASALVMAQQQPPQNPTPPQQPGQPQQPGRQDPQPGVQRPDGKTQAGQDKDGNAEPVAEHRNLDQFVGTWQVTGTCWAGAGPTEKTAAGAGGATPQPGAGGATPQPAAGSSSPKTISGTVTSEWVLGKHFIKSHMKATEGGESIEGIGFCGYDPAKGKYVSTWHSDQCNSIMVDEGNYEQGQKVFTYTNQMTGPDGKSIQCRRVVKVLSPDEHTMTIYSTEAGKGEQKMTELTFKRTSGRTARAED